MEEAAQVGEGCVACTQLRTPPSLSTLPHLRLATHHTTLHRIRVWQTHLLSGWSMRLTRTTIQQHSPTHPPCCCCCTLCVQVLEIETFIPMLLQRQQDGHSRLKRVILIGDHHQLPPVVKNQAIQRYSHLDQSLFARFIRLGTPYIELNAQVGVGWGWGRGVGAGGVRVGAAGGAVCTGHPSGATLR